MREPNDIKLAEKIPAELVDVIFGGHDHYYAHHHINGAHVLRSGSDFKQLSYVEARRKENGQPGWDIDIIRRDVIRAIPEDKASIELVKSLTSSMKQKLEKPMGYTMVPLDGRFTTVRAKESNLGNFACDLMRYYYNADCTLMAAGTMRGDQIYTPGVLQIKDIMKAFPFEDPVVVLRIKGKNILSALENGVSLVPALEGRYPQVSNIQFKYDPALPAGSRLLWARINDEPLDLEREYLLATRGYMARGKDGYDSLLIKSEGGEAEEIISEEHGILISMIIRQYFLSLKVLGKWTGMGPDMGAHWNGINEQLHEGGKVHEPEGAPQNTSGTSDIDSDVDDYKDIKKKSSTIKAEQAAEDERRKRIARNAVKKWMRVTGLKVENVEVAPEQASSSSVPHWTKGIAPR